MSRRLIVLISLVLACGHRTRPLDYATARSGFHTKLVRQGPSPQAAEPAPLAADAVDMPYQSGPLALHAWMSVPSNEKRPAVVFIHGGSAFGGDDWEMTRPFRDAGFVVMMPILRSENGSPGAYSLFYDEVDDVIAATETLANQPGVDATRMFIAGHSNGGTLTMLVAMTSHRFRAAAALSGLPDANGLTGPPEMVPFDQSDPNEGRMRSAIEFAGSFTCPVRLYLGEQETGAETFAELARLARAAGRDVDLVRVPGTHFTMPQAAIPLAIELFTKAK